MTFTNIIIRNKLMGWILWRLGYACRCNNGFKIWYRLRKGEEDKYGMYPEVR